MIMMQAVEQECNNLGALLQHMLALLSKPHKAADLFAREQAARSTAAAPGVEPLPGTSEPCFASVQTNA